MDDPSYHQAISSSTSPSLPLELFSLLLIRTFLATAYAVNSLMSSLQSSLLQANQHEHIQISTLKSSC